MKGERILFIGLDSAEPTLLDVWCDDGTLPSLAAFRSRAVHARVYAPEGFGNGAVWPSLFTGLNPGEHGRYNSHQIKVGTYDVVPFDTDRDFMAEPFWVELGRNEVRVGIVDMVRAPLTRGINGFQVADWLTHDPRSDEIRSYPDSLKQEVCQQFGDGSFRGTSEEGFPNVEDGLEDFLASMEDRIQRKTDMTLHYARRHDWKLFMSVYGEPHDAGHRLWHLHDPNHPRFNAQLSEQYGNPLKRAYQAIDRGVGRVIEAMPDVTVMVFAGPGMQPANTGNPAMSRVLKAFGVPESVPVKEQQTGLRMLRAAARRAVPGRVRMRIRRSLPHSTIRLIKSADRGAAFSIPYPGMAGAVRINLIGREPNGKVSRADYDQVCDELTRRMLDVKNAETGTPVVKTVVRTHETCSGGALDVLPDLLVIWNREAPIRSIEVPGRSSFDVSPHHRTGDHSANCSILVSGPGIAKGRQLDPIRAEDIAPTISAAFGLMLGRTDGAVVPGLVPTRP